MSWCFMSLPVPWTGGLWDQVPAPILRTWDKSATPHSQLAAPTHTAEAGRATRSSCSMSWSQLRGPKAGDKGRMRWRWPDMPRLWRWKWPGQNRDRTLSHPWFPAHELTAVTRWQETSAQAKASQTSPKLHYKEVGPRWISRSTGLCLAITIQRTITILTSSLYIWSAEPKPKP